MARNKKKWIQKAIKKPGSFTDWCKKRGYRGATAGCIEEGMRSRNPTIRRRASLARTLRDMNKKKRKRKKR